MALRSGRRLVRALLRRREPSPPTAGSRQFDDVRLALGRIESRTVRAARYRHLQEAEFRVFSQFGEDGIIQYLVNRVPIARELFVEFGVEDYRESNTRFLLANDNWQGLILDGGTAHIDFVRSDPIGWRHSIDARSVFVTRENINEVLRTAGVEGDIGLLSVDIDGNDYWVLDAIEAISPRILVAEYNSTFGPTRAVTIPYDPGFRRSEAHISHLYWGASLGAICQAAERKGLAFVGSNRAGNNAFFVRRDLLGDLATLAPSEGWVDARFREARNADGTLSYVGTRAERIALIRHLPLVDVADETIIKVGDCLDDGTSAG